MEIVSLIIAILVAVGSVGYYFGFRGREVIVGIDLGTSYSVAAVKVNGEITIIPHYASKKFLVPSIVSYPGGKVGPAAEASGRIYHAKRFIGRSFEEAAEDVASHPDLEIVADAKGFATFKTADGLKTPIDIGIAIIKDLLKSIKAHLDLSASVVVVCVPVSFRTLEREHTRKVFQSLGLTLASTVEEPVAAAVAYNLHRITEGNRRALIFDLGGGTFDVTVLWVAESGSITVLGSSGDAAVGGQDFDAVLLPLLTEQCPGATMADAEAAKIELTDRDEVTRAIGACNARVSNSEFEAVSSELLLKISEKVTLALEDQMLKAEDVEDLVLVGGASRMPIIRKFLKKYFAHSPKTRFHDSLDPDTVVALGAANILGSKALG